jgi:hypothetical protein
MEAAVWVVGRRVNVFFDAGNSYPDSLLVQQLLFCGIIQFLVLRNSITQSGYHENQAALPKNTADSLPKNTYYLSLISERETAVVGCSLSLMCSFTDTLEQPNT